MARPAKAINVQSKHNTKAETEKRKIVEDKLRGKSDKLIPPESFTKNQKQIFNFIYKELEASNILSNLDIFVLTNTAITIDRIQQYDKAIAEDSERLYDNVTINNRDRSVREFLRYCTELCLSPQARAKIGSLALSKEKEQADPVLSLIKGD